ncbi:MAG: hypothetical protein WAN25_00565, partial [Candidatus Acidiferrum sp.]
SSRSLSFKRPSTYATILFSIRVQLMTAFLLYPRSTSTSRGTDLKVGHYNFPGARVVVAGL